jgi:hypothetical protein
MNQGNIEEEDRKRDVTGLSATGKCIVLKELLESFALTLSAKSTLETAARELLANKSLKHLPGWSAETMSRYAHVGQKLMQTPLMLAELEVMEYKFGRTSVFDGIAALRSLTSLGLADADGGFLELPLDYLWLC